MKQFSLRDLLFIVVIISLLFGWWVDRQNRGQVVGRFQIHTRSQFSPSGSPRGSEMVMLDTATGQVWLTSSGEFRQPKVP